MDSRYLVEHGGYTTEKLTPENKSFVDGIECALKIIDKYIAEKGSKCGCFDGLVEYCKDAYCDIVVSMIDDQDAVLDGDEEYLRDMV